MGLLDEVSYAPSLLMMNAFPATSAYRPDLPAVAQQKFDRVRDFGPRWNESVQAPTKTSLKGYGWLGLMPTKDGGVMSEYSTGDDRGSYPLVNPLLNRQEVDWLLGSPNERPKAGSIGASAYDKANAWAQMRRMQNLDPFID